MLRNEPYTNEDGLRAYRAGVEVPDCVYLHRYSYGFVFWWGFLFGVVVASYLWLLFA